MIQAAVWVGTPPGPARKRGGPLAAAAVCGCDSSCATGLLRQGAFTVLGHLLTGELMDLADGSDLRDE